MTIRTGPNTIQAVLQERRNALAGKRHDINFYGGWYSVDNVTGKAKSHGTMEQALAQAEENNS